MEFLISKNQFLLDRGLQLVVFGAICDYIKICCFLFQSLDNILHVVCSVLMGNIYC
jgi:hypothetical protein